MSTTDNRTNQLVQALKSELASKPLDYRFTAAELGAIDQIHTRGYAATVDFAHAVGITKDLHVLDIGSGMGGPARYLAETYGCRVEGVDAMPALVEVANYLSTRWVGAAAPVTFTTADAVSLPFPDRTFDLVWMQHVAMNVADRDCLYREIRRVLRQGGRLATYDVVRAGGELIYPTPWAPSADVSTVLTADETRDAMERAGFQVVSLTIDTPAALEWARKTVSTLPGGVRPPGASIMRAALGENFGEIVGNLGKNYLEGRADVVAIVARRE